MRPRLSHLFAALLAAAATLGGTWAAGFLNSHPRLENALDRELVRLRAFGLPCGVERWSVKTLADQAAASIGYATHTYTNIPKLRALPNDQPSAREAPTETTVFQLTKTHVIAFKLEGDSDIHLVLKSGIDGSTMIAEIPDPGCINANSDPATFNAQIQIGQVRAAFMAYVVAHGLSLQTFFQTVDWKVTLRGVGFLDFGHGQTGVAPNAIELHPLLFFRGY
jgi:hypothetical protein